MLIDLNISYKSSDAEYDDNIDFVGIRLKLKKKELIRIKTIQSFMQDNPDVIMITLSLGEFLYIKDENIDSVSEVSDSTEFTNESEYRHHGLELKIFRERIYPALQSKHNASNEIEFESFELEDKSGQRVFEVEGYYKDDNTSINGYLITNYHQCPSWLEDDNILYYGLEEKDIIQAIKDEKEGVEDALEFRITNYSDVTKAYKKE